MIGRVIFLTAAAFVGYRYIRRSNQQVQKEIAEAPGTVQILPPDESATLISGAATESLRTPRVAPRLSAAAEDLRGK
jgi:hypothetical protein